MPVTDTLITDPVLDVRAEEDRIAARIHRSIGGLTEIDAQMIIDYGRSLLSMIQSAGAISDPLLPELSSARPAEVHVVLLTEIERGFTETLFRLNQLPNKARIALLRLLGVSLRPAVVASTVLQFSKTDDYLNIEVTIPQGIEVSTEDRSIRASTDIELVIASGVPSGTVAATAVDEGDIGRLPVNSIGLLLQSVAGIATVRNSTPLTGGANSETVDQGKIRAREEFDIGEHLGSIQDFEAHIFFELLRRKGRVTGFEKHLADFSLATLGYVLLVVQGDDGLAPTQATLDLVAEVVNARHVAGLQVSVRPPIYKPFDLEIDVTIAAGQNPTTLVNKAKANLRMFFEPLRFAFGPNFPDRSISLSDIVGQVEAAGANLISVKTAGNRFAVTITVDDAHYQSDIGLTLGELPLLGEIRLNT